MITQACNTISPALKLKAIKRLRLTDGLGHEDAHDIAIWCCTAGANYEMEQFGAKVLERIEQIFHRFFEE